MARALWCERAPAAIFTEGTNEGLEMIVCWGLLEVLLCELVKTPRKRAVTSLSLTLRRSSCHF